MSFYKFNAFTGTVKPASQLEAVYPLAPNPLQKVDPPNMIFDAIKTKVATSIGSKKQGYSTLSPKMIKLQQQYQADLTKPTYLLRGGPDKMLYGFSCAMLAITTLLNAYYFTQLLKKYG
ncbi:uncharacterized protein LOC143433000 [Xylocopa sonorina]|uniref:uncharacterized protein LOC143433000 n=1 Tax=Xylocopa sonorina TaxID=1818115 RepID=UPI00403A8C97